MKQAVSSHTISMCMKEGISEDKLLIKQSRENSLVKVAEGMETSDEKNVIRRKRRVAFSEKAKIVVRSCTPSNVIIPTTETLNH